MARPGLAIPPTSGELPAVPTSVYWNSEMIVCGA
jgi:hypothetical protein